MEMARCRFERAEGIQGREMAFLHGDPYFQGSPIVPGNEAPVQIAWLFRPRGCHRAEFIPRADPIAYLQQATRQ
jgi:hypothetical protein